LLASSVVASALVEEVVSGVVGFTIRHLRQFWFLAKLSSPQEQTQSPGFWVGEIALDVPKLNGELTLAEALDVPKLDVLDAISDGTVLHALHD